MDTRWSAQIGHLGSIGDEMTHDEVIQHLQGGQVQVSGQHVPLLGHGDAIESTNSNPLHVDEI